MPGRDIGRDIAGGLSRAAKAAARPKEAAHQAAEAARDVAAKGAEAAEKALHHADAGDAEQRDEHAESAAPGAGEHAETGSGEPGELHDPHDPQVVLAEPAPPSEPPVDIVEQVLASEAEGGAHGRATEPRAGSRGAEHGEAHLARAEEEEIAEEVAEAFPGGDLDLETPVGTTGADTGHNPDTAEASLQQPGTEPLLDPSLTNEVKAEQDTLHKAADEHKE